MTEYRLGKEPAVHDARNIKFKSIVRAEALPDVPVSCDVDEMWNHAPIENPMYANDVWGDCVIAGRAHMTRRFEVRETGKILEILDEEVLNEYWAEGRGGGVGFPMSWVYKLSSCGKPDKGLVVLDSLKSWKHKGWTVGDKVYTIHAFAQVDPLDMMDVKACIYLLNGLYLGLALPNSARGDQYLWKDVGDVPAGWGYHCVYVVAYHDQGILDCITWGHRQKMTVPFFQRYADEAYGCVDNRNHWLPDSPIDVVKLDEYLKAVSKT